MIEVKHLFQQLEHPVAYRRRIAKREVPEDLDGFWTVYRFQARLEFCEPHIEIVTMCTADAGEERRRGKGGTPWLSLLCDSETLIA